MAIRSLTALVAASEDRTAQTGDSFLVDVDGAAAFVGMVDYILSDWNSWASSDYDSQTIFPSGTILHFTFNFDAGIRYQDIRPIAAVLSAELTDNISYGSVEAVANLTVTWDTAGLYTTCTIEAELIGSTSTWPQGPTYETLRLRFLFPQDTGNFNDQLIKTYDPLKLATRYVPPVPSAPTTVPLSLTITGQAGACRGDWLNTNEEAGTSIRIEWQKWNGSAWDAYSSYNLAYNTLNHTETGLTEGWLMRYRVIYYNAGGDSTGGYATSGSDTVEAVPSAPTETPDSPTLSNMGGSVGRAAWTNTNTTDQIEVQFYKDSGGGMSPFGASVQLAAGTTQEDKAGYTGEGIFDVWYFNGAGTGPVATGGPAFF